MSKLTAYRIGDQAPKIVPAQQDREWMSQTQFRFAYRCLPLTIANSMGWEVLCPMAIAAEWDGGDAIESIRISSPDGADAHMFANSHFGHGVLTFHLQYLFRTDEGIGLWVRGSPNRPKDGIAPLDGIIETDWLNFTFTMNWKFTRPGRIAFELDEPFCFLTPFNYRGLDAMTSEIKPLEANPQLAADFQDYASRRREFTEGLIAGDPATLKEGWQKWYMRGKQPSGEVGNTAHLSKIRFPTPKVSDGEASNKD